MSQDLKQALPELKQATEDLFKELEAQAAAGNLDPSSSGLKDKMKQHQSQVLTVLIQYMLTYTDSLDDLELFSSDLVTFLGLLKNNNQSNQAEVDRKDLLKIQEWIKGVTGNLASGNQGWPGGGVRPRYP